MKDKDKEKKTLGWITGSAVLTLLGFKVIPPLITKYGNKLYKMNLKRIDVDIDHLQPEIVKKKSDN